MSFWQGREHDPTHGRYRRFGWEIGMFGKVGEGRELDT